MRSIIESSYLPSQSADPRDRAHSQASRAGGIDSAAGGESRSSGFGTRRQAKTSIAASTRSPRVADLQWRKTVVKRANT